MYETNQFFVHCSWQIVSNAILQNEKVNLPLNVEFTFTGDSVTLGNNRMHYRWVIQEQKLFFLSDDIKNTFSGDILIKNTFSDGILIKNTFSDDILIKNTFLMIF